MRLASFNLENLFDRARALSLGASPEGRAALDAFERVNVVLSKLAYSPSDTTLRDVSSHLNYQSDGRPGTFANGTASNKIDYILLSPALFDKVTSGGVFRKGVWGGVNGTLWPIYPEMTKESEAASDHAAIFAEFDLP